MGLDQPSYTAVMMYADNRYAASSMHGSAYACMMANLNRSSVPDRVKLIQNDAGH